MTDLTIAALAAEARAHFMKKTRDNGTTFWVVAGGGDAELDWMRQMARDAHGDTFPDDYRYAFTVDALEAIAEQCDARYAGVDPSDVEAEADIYTRDLLKWLASRNDRLGYCDQYAEENEDSDTLNRISGGQYLERREVLGSVVDSLEAELGARGGGDNGEEHSYRSDCDCLYCANNWRRGHELLPE